MPVDQVATTSALIGDRGILIVLGAVMVIAFGGGAAILLQFGRQLLTLVNRAIQKVIDGDGNGQASLTKLDERLDNVEASVTEIHQRLADGDVSFHSVGDRIDQLPCQVKPPSCPEGYLDEPT